MSPEERSRHKRVLDALVKLNLVELLVLAVMVVGLLGVDCG